jgi:FkbM family methyltransferase
MNLELANNGNYNGLFGEIVTLDCYRLSTLPFTPDTIIDLGANVGIFTRHCRGLFPDALIISVEPDTDNFEYLKVGNDHHKTKLLKKAVGTGNIYRLPNALNGAHECYLSEGVGYSGSDLKLFETVDVSSIMLPDLSRLITGKVLLKVDIEGNDTVIMNDPESVELIKTFDYITFEIHNYAQTHDKVIEVRRVVSEFIEALSITHEIIMDHSYIFATHKKYNLN